MAAIRVGMMTFLHNHNYGSMLQAYALQQAVRSLGFDAEYLDYDPSTKEKLRNLICSGNSPKLIFEGMAKKKVQNGQLGSMQKGKKLDQFRTEKLHLSAPCHDYTDLKRAAKDYDILMAGSDQIWSPVWLNGAYFMNFGSKQTKVCYAPSMGVSQLKNKRKRNLLKSLTSQFNCLAVREQAGADLLSEITGRPVKVIPDPVFLLSRDEWLKESSYPAAKEYLLVYFIGENESYWEQVEKMAIHAGKKVIVIPTTAESYTKPYEKADGLSPQEWLGYFANAAGVITDSFHGAAFSCLFGVEPTVIRRYSQHDPESKNSRLDQLFENIGWKPGLAFNDVIILEKLAALRETGLNHLKAILDT